MYKNQLQELAQRSCFNLPSYTCIREGPDHAPRFKATVNFNGETFESTGFFTTLRQAEHSAAEVALSALSTRGPSHSLTARILDETGVYKNLLQEIAQRVGAPLPSYTTTRSGLGHPPVFTGTVELAGIIFTGEPAKNKKQAEKNSAMAAWSSLKQLAQQAASSSSAPENNDEQEQVTLARALLSYRRKEKMAMADDPDATPFPKLFPFKPDKRPALRPPPSSGSKILPFIQQRSTTRARPPSLSPVEAPLSPSPNLPAENGGFQLPKFPAAGAAPYVPIRHCRPFMGGMVPPVTIRTAVPVFSAPTLPLPTSNTMSYHQPQPQPQPQQQHQWQQQQQQQHPLPVKCSTRHVAPSVHLRQSVPVSAVVAPPVAFMPVQVKEGPKAAAPPAYMVASPAGAMLASPSQPVPVAEETRCPEKPPVVVREEIPLLWKRPSAQIPEMSPLPPKPSAVAAPPALPPALLQAEEPSAQTEEEPPLTPLSPPATTTQKIGPPAVDAAGDGMAEDAAAAVAESLKQLEL